MQIDRVEVYSYPVPFKTVFRHASATRARAENIVVALRSLCGQTGYGEGCPRSYVSGETTEGGRLFVAECSDSLKSSVTDIESLRDWVNARADLIDKNPAACCALELAVLDLIGKVEGSSVEAVLGLPQLSGAFGYSAVLGDAPFPAYWWQFRRYWANGMRDFKVKVSGDARRDARKMAFFQRRPDPALRVRLDANNLWSDADHCVRHINSLGYEFFAVEEPLKPGNLAGFQRVGLECDTKIVLDESLLRVAQIHELPDTGRWIINLRVSKMGGILRSLNLAEAAAEKGIPIIVGSQVGETSILTRAALVVMNARRDILVGAEGAFGTYLLKRDLTEPSLRFGEGGYLTPDQFLGEHETGFGLSVRAGELEMH